MLVDKQKVSSPLSVDAIPYDTLFQHSHSMFDCTLEMAKKIMRNERWIEKNFHDNVACCARKEKKIFSFLVFAE